MVQHTLCDPLHTLTYSIVYHHDIRLSTVYLFYVQMKKYILVFLLSSRIVSMYIIGSCCLSLFDVVLATQMGILWPPCINCCNALE